MRMVDFACECGWTSEMAEPSGERLIPPRHCGRPSRRVIVAPAVVGVQRAYSHAVGREVTNRELERELAKKDSYVPSQREFNEVREMTENRVLPEAFGKVKNDAELKKAAEKAHARFEREKSQGMHRES